MMFDNRAKIDDSDLTQDAEQVCQEQKVKDAAEDVSRFSESEKSTSAIVTPPGETQKNCFQWFSSFTSKPGNPSLSHTVFSQQFHEQRSNCVVSQEDQLNGVQAEGKSMCGEVEEKSSLLTELEELSESQRSCELPEHKLESSEGVEVSENKSHAEVRKLDIASTFAFPLHPNSFYDLKFSFQNYTLQIM